MYTEHMLFAEIEYRREQARKSWPGKPARSRRQRSTKFWFRQR